MKKCLLLVALLVVSQLNNLKAQTLFTAPDTICVRQSITLSTSVNASSYYWGFCSGYLLNTPIGTNLGSGFSFNAPSAMDIAKDSGKYYAFVTNAATNELLRLDFGTSLNDTPTVTNYGSLGGYLPKTPTTLYIVKDSSANNWYVFIAGGTDTASSTLARLDFGHSLNNSAPNIVNFGNLNNALDAPHGLFVASEGGNWYGFAVNNGNNSFTRMDFGSNISLTPNVTNEGNIGNLDFPTDMAATVDNLGDWNFFITNISNSLVVVNMGSLTNTAPVGIAAGNPSSQLAGPTSISLIKDCGSIYAFVTDATTNELVRIDIDNFSGPYTATNYGSVGALSHPSSITRFIRSDDNVYGFIANTDNTLTRAVFSQCTKSSIVSSASMNPPLVQYDTPGVYNIYLATDEGLPTMQMQCHQITVLPIPDMQLSMDTAVCQGDSATLTAFSGAASKFAWTPQYNLNLIDTIGNAVKVAPDYSLRYTIILSYPDGCIVDTSIGVKVTKIKADAGPDRTISDGAVTLLGGPLTTTGPGYTYYWFPAQYLNNITIPQPVASPHYDYTYYLKVEEHNDTLKCQSIDTVVVHVDCENLNLPNVFAPGSTNPGSNTFGILNNQVIKLDYLRVFDRWGNKVFETTDPTQKWDGFYNGTAEPMGVYVWEASGYCISGQKFTRSGNVTLIR